MKLLKTIFDCKSSSCSWFLGVFFYSVGFAITKGAWCDHTLFENVLHNFSADEIQMELFYEDEKNGFINGEK